MFHFYTPENVRKPKGFWRFQGVYKWNIELKWVKILSQDLFVFSTILWPHWYNNKYGEYYKNQV